MSDLLSPQAESPPWMVVYVSYNVVEAHIVAGRLQNEGIPAWVHQEPAGSAFGITFGPLGEVRVFVNYEDYERALVLLEGEPEPDALPDDVDRLIYEDDSDLLEDEDSDTDDDE